MTTEIKQMVEQIGTTFEEYKRTNDAKLEAIKASKATGDMEAKLAKMDGALDSMTEIKSKLEAIREGATTVELTDAQAKLVASSSKLWVQSGKPGDPLLTSAFGARPGRKPGR